MYICMYNRYVSYLVGNSSVYIMYTNAAKHTYRLSDRRTLAFSSQFHIPIWPTAFVVREAATSVGLKFTTTQSALQGHSRLTPLAALESSD